jgi:hypothetical protein
MAPSHVQDGVDDEDAQALRAEGVDPLGIFIEASVELDRRTRLTRRYWRYANLFGLR